MTIDALLFEDIVPPPTWVERNLPTLLHYGRAAGILSKPEEPNKVNIPDYGTVVMPEYDFTAGTRPIVYYVDKLGEILDRTDLADGVTNIKLNLSHRSFEELWHDIPARGDDNMFGAAMFKLMALSRYVGQRFEDKPYKVISIGANTGYQLHVEVAKK